MAKSFRQIAEDLTFKIRVFSDFQAAEDWVKEFKIQAIDS
jgi:hypothetical protein